MFIQIVDGSIMAYGTNYIFTFFSIILYDIQWIK